MIICYHAAAVAVKELSVVATAVAVAVEGGCDCCLLFKIYYFIVVDILFYCNRYIILLCCLYYFIVLKAKIDPLQYVCR